MGNKTANVAKGKLTLKSTREEIVAKYNDQLENGECVIYAIGQKEKEDWFTVAVAMKLTDVPSHGSSANNNSFAVVNFLRKKHGIENQQGNNIYQAWFPVDRETLEAEGLKAGTSFEDVKIRVVESTTAPYAEAEPRKSTIDGKLVERTHNGEPVYMKTYVLPTDEWQDHVILTYDPIVDNVKKKKPSAAIKSAFKTVEEDEE